MATSKEYKDFILFGTCQKSRDLDKIKCNEYEDCED